MLLVWSGGRERIKSRWDGGEMFGEGMEDLVFGGRSRVGFGLRLLSLWRDDMTKGVI